MSERTRLEAIRERATIWHHPCATYRPDCEDCRERWLLERVDELVKAISMQPPRQFSDSPCFCRTSAGTYCVAQPACSAINKALAALHAKETDRG